jgi:hypothetical protein
VEAAPVESVLQAAEFEKFEADYQAAWLDLNKPGKEA